MNGLLCRAMYDMATIEHDLHGKAWVAMQDNFIEDERTLCDAAKAVKAAAMELADANGDSGEELALLHLHELALWLVDELRYDRLMLVHDSLTQVPSAH